MEQMIYERPREKLRNQGVGALSVSELLQLVIGSGNARVSGAQLARSIERHMLKGTVSYGALMSIAGMGEAKTCQVLAVLELAKRVTRE